MTSVTKTVTLLWILQALAACGGAQPQTDEPAPPPAAAEEPAAAAQDEAPSSGETPSAASSGDKKEPEKPAASEAAANESASKPASSPKDTLSAEGVLFSFSFSDSEIYRTAEKQCSDDAGDDPKKKADCMAKARDKVDHDGMIFKKETDGKWAWITLRRAGAKVTVLHKFDFEFGEETATSITIKPKGRDQGTKPMAAPPKVVIDVNESGITLTDPKFGKMVYLRKMGAVGDPGR